MRVLKLLKEVGKDLIKKTKLSFKKLGLCIFTLAMIILFIGVIAVIPAIVLHKIWLTNIEIDDLAFAILLSELLIVILVGFMVDFIKYIKKKWNEVK